MSLIHRVGWVWALEKNVTKFYVTNWGGTVGLRPNMYDVTNFTLFLKSSLWNMVLSVLVQQGEGT